MRKEIISVLVIIAIFFGCWFYVDKKTQSNVIKDNTEKIDTLKSKIDTQYLTIKDTIYKKGKDKVRVESVFVVETLKISDKDTTELKITFNNVFPRLGDTTKTVVGYSQIKKTLIVNEKFIRDSSLLTVTNSQLGICTTGLTSIKLKADSALDSSKKLVVNSYNKGYDEGNTNNKKSLLYGGIGIFVLGFLGGHYF